MTLFPLLILFPIAAWVFASRSHRWLATAAAFGTIAYPFFFGLTVLTTFVVPALVSISGICANLAILHRTPAYVILTLATGSRPRLETDLAVFGLCAVVWGIAYGIAGWIIDRRKLRKSQAASA
jgi:hypothetical protein